MTIKRKQFVKPSFLEGKSGDEAAVDLQRILGTKADSHSAIAIVGTFADLWNAKAVQSKANAVNATKPRAKDRETGRIVTADEIEEARNAYVAQHGFERGFWSGHAPAFSMSARTLKRRWKEKFGTATAKDK
jgi:hypothetical protein